jgi:hypothetical protein
MPINDGEFKTGRHLYRRGWLGLIPLVGGFVGIGLMVLGIFKYRDKKLFLIGLAALLFTVAIYSSLYFYSTYSVTARGQWAEMSKLNLNTLVSHIEFYKLQNGSYPDSLKRWIAPWTG